MRQRRPHQQSAFSKEYLTRGGEKLAPRNSRYPKVERDRLVPGLVEERDEERPEAAVDVQAKSVLNRQVRQRRDIW